MRYFYVYSSKFDWSRDPSRQHHIENLSLFSEFWFQSLNAMKDSVTDIIGDGEFCSEDGANKLVHGAIEKAADNVTNKIKAMEIKGFYITKIYIFLMKNFA